ncbi:hypothetical protein [Thiolapillus sp.]|uniref:hypothetical protein n=1 Tax=Thiolapillus sp. TaxID=2017437 RepID=UPI0025F21202|nr:hypothetical protein [Thiolapillus sp.]
MTRTAGARIGCQRPSRFWGLGCPKIYHEVEDTLVSLNFQMKACKARQRYDPCYVNYFLRFLVVFLL